MAQPWQIIDRVETVDGAIELRLRGERDFLIVFNGRVLMNSAANRSEIALGERACRIVAERRRPKVLIGGLGMGLTLRAALDSLPPEAELVVAELNPVIVQWCRGPLADLTQSSVDDRRVSVEVDDVASVIAKAAQSASGQFDAIIIDLYEGPSFTNDSKRDPIYGSDALKKTAAALSFGGVFAVWGENPEAGFEKRLAATGFSVERLRPGRGGLRHVVYLARLTRPVR